MRMAFIKSDKKEKKNRERKREMILIKRKRVKRVRKGSTTRKEETTKFIEKIIKMKSENRA